MYINNPAVLLVPDTVKRKNPFHYPIYMMLMLEKPITAPYACKFIGQQLTKTNGPANTLTHS